MYPVVDLLYLFDLEESVMSSPDVWQHLYRRPVRLEAKEYNKWLHPSVNLAYATSTIGIRAIHAVIRRLHRIRIDNLFYPVG